MLRIIVLLLVFMCGCQQPVNPSFPVTIQQADGVISTLSKHPRSLQRPLVIVGGFMDAGIGPYFVKQYIAPTIADDRILLVQVGFCKSFDECRDKLIASVESAYPSTNQSETTQVDVLGLSMGGLVARYSAVDLTSVGHLKRLKIKNLFTISSPHTGALLANDIAITSFHKDMQPASPFLRMLAENDAKADYALYTYTRLNDTTVGAQYASPPGVVPFWVSNPMFGSVHMGAMKDSRIIADILLRLRDEPTLSHQPPSPLPPD